MKQFFLRMTIICVCLILLIGGGASFFLPGLVSTQIENELKTQLQPESQSIRIESSPGIKLALGTIDSFRGNLEGLTLGRLAVKSLSVDLKHTEVNPIDMFLNRTVTMTSYGDGKIQGIVEQESLKNFIESYISEKNAKGLTIESVQISSQGIIMTGDINLGGFISGKVTIEGNLEVKDNTLQFSTQRFAIEGASLGRLSSGAVKAIPLYDFKEFPIPVTVDRVDTVNEEIHIYLKPVTK